MGLPPPGSGPYSLSLETAGFVVLAVSLALFVLMFLVLRSYHPNRKRGLEGYLEGAGVSLVFLVFAFVLVVAIAAHDPHGNKTSYALYTTVLTGYWLAFAIPVVTVASSIQARSRGAIPWLIPSMIVAALMFVGLFGYYYLAPA
ncbi:MAG: hypothetical protein L3K02_06295 [Thermoplasmata archaeon]|nr:hypothetical protein [Thermoplasmata archaeon]